MARQDTVVVELEDAGGGTYRFSLDSVPHTLRRSEDLWVLDPAAGGDEADDAEELAFTTLGEAIHFLLDSDP